jgi:hypothetical protein
MVPIYFNVPNSYNLNNLSILNHYISQIFRLVLALFGCYSLPVFSTVKVKAEPKKYGSGSMVPLSASLSVSKLSTNANNIMSARSQ